MVVNNVTDALVEIVRSSGKQVTQISKNLGHYYTYVSAFITNRRDVQTSTLASIARECGYTLTLVPDDDGGEPIEILPD